MLFNSYPFIFAFLPTVLIGAFSLGAVNKWLGISWLCLSSIFFYGYWNSVFVPLLLLSIAWNFGVSLLIARSAERRKIAARWLFLAISVDLCLLAYFKYANFLIDSTSQLLHVKITTLDIVLPLGISFFTFTQIAFLVDVYRKEVREFSILNYVLFVTYFPHLIAGPILHHKQMMPQFRAEKIFKFIMENISVGLSIFILGLAKKVLIADSLASYTDLIFDTADKGFSLKQGEAWVGALAYSLQLYFDFSGYCDMAVGLSLMLNVRLPMNFDSPYKATSIIDFWRRWHMTLSAFLREYL